MHSKSEMTAKPDQVNIHVNISFNDRRSLRQVF